MTANLIGNELAKDFLRRIIAAGRLPGAFLFAGPDGVGKKQFALQVAKSFLCEKSTALKSCGECRVCRRADKFTFPTSEKKEDYEKVFISEYADVGQVIPFKRSILVNAIRELEREANFRPYEGKARFFIIDDADKMNPQAANALLKTLEEPPETTYIFLITSRYNSLLPTIISRCQVLQFQPIEKTEIEKFLLNTKQFSPDDAALAANVSQGSLARALQMSGEDFRRHREAMMEVLEAQTLQPNRAKLLRAAEEMGDTKMKSDYEPRLEILQGLAHDAWQLKKGRAKNSITNADLADRLEKCGSKITADSLTAFIAEIERVREDLLVNVNRKIATDALFLSAAK